MNRRVSPVLQVALMVAVTIILAAVVGALLLPGDAAADREPVQNLSAFVGEDGDCVLTGTFDPSSHGDADRIVVEIESWSIVMDSRTDYWRQDIRRGSNLSIYAVDRPDGVLDRGGVTPLLDGRFGADCQLVRGEGA